MFIGDELQSILDSIESGAEYTDVYKTKMDLGAAVLPPIPKDTTDRNRTSPFAFTGNKFEFRSLGSAVNIACANVMLNTAVAEELRQFADELEGAEDFEAAVYALVKREIKAHKRIIFNGNGYDESWVARRRSAACSTSRARQMHSRITLTRRTSTCSQSTMFTPLRRSIPVWRPSLRSTTRSCTSRL